MIFPRKLIEQEFSNKRSIEIPGKPRELYVELGKPTPLLRARKLEEYLNTPAKIYHEYEGVLLAESHEIDTAVAQVYFNMLEGVEILTSESTW